MSAPICTPRHAPPFEPNGNDLTSLNLRRLCWLVAVFLPVSLLFLVLNLFSLDYRGMIP